MVWNEPHSHMPQQLGFIFLLNWRAVYSLSAAMTAAMSSLIGNHTMDLFYLLNKNFKNLLFDSLIPQKNFESLSYLSSCSLSQRWRFRRICSNVLQGIESDLAYTKVSGVASQYILRSGSIWHPLSSSMLKNFFISNCKTKVCFLSMTAQLGVANTWCS